MKTQLRILGVLTAFSFLFYSCEKDAEVTDLETGIETDSFENIGADQAIPGSIYCSLYKGDQSFEWGKSPNTSEIPTNIIKILDFRRVI